MDYEKAWYELKELLYGEIKRLARTGEGCKQTEVMEILSEMIDKEVSE